MTYKRPRYKHSDKFFGRDTGSKGSSSGSSSNSRHKSFRTSFGGKGGRPMNKRKFKVWETSELLRVVARDNNSNPQNTNQSKQNIKNEITHTSFNEFKLSPQILTNIKDMGYTQPTPIQDKAIPVVISGQNLIGNANTGTGKTAAFLIPLIDKVFKNRNERVLIVTPTRELSAQIYDEFRALCKDTGIFTAVVIGGLNLRRQIAMVRKNPNFIIGTPGRLKDLINQKFLDISKFGNVVLDEADLMVDIGFVNEIKFFMDLLPKKRQTLLFSATFPVKVEEIIKSFIQNPVKINVKNRDTAENVEQVVVKTHGRKKLEVLDETLRQEGFSKVLIFGSTKHGVQKLSDELVSRGYKAGAIHGNKRQSQRMQILGQFKKCEINILLATDVASRGLDIDNVSHVINYDMPESYESYIHRIGRTGRVDKKGIALTFIEN